MTSVFFGLNPMLSNIAPRSLFFVLSFWTAPAVAGEFLIGVGAEDSFEHEIAPALVVEYRLTPFFKGEISEYAIGVAAQIDSDADFWAGIGISAVWSISDHWFIEGSLMPGLYHKGSDGLDLGGDFQFRSLIGLGYRLENSAKISFAIDHKSNASTNPFNPGSEMVALRYA